MTTSQRQDLIEVIEDRNGRLTTLIASQLPTELSHGHICKGALTDAILDRLPHGAHRIPLFLG